MSGNPIPDQSYIGLNNVVCRSACYTNAYDDVALAELVHSLFMVIEGGDKSNETKELPAEAIRKH